MIDNGCNENGFDMDDPYPLKPYDKVIINAAMTGMVPTKKETPYVPVTIDEIIEDATKCVTSGASILHIHARDKDGKPTYKKEVYAQIIEGIRARCHDAIICVSTSGRIHKDFEKRSQVLEMEGDAKPDMASLTLGSLNLPHKASINEPEMIMALTNKMKERGIKPELELLDTGMLNTAKYLSRKGYIQPPFYFNIILGSVYSTQAKMSEFSYLVDLLPRGAIWAGGGFGIFQLVVNTSALLMGGHVRVGIEDNIWYDNGKEELTSNVKSIERIKRLSLELGREIATPEESRKMIGL